MVAAGIDGDRAGKSGLGAGDNSLVVGEEFLVRREFQVERQGIKPIFGSINLGEWLNALTATGKIIMVIIRILAEGETPFAEIV